MGATGPTLSVRRYVHQKCGAALFVTSVPDYCPDCGDPLRDADGRRHDTVAVRGGFVVRRERTRRSLGSSRHRGLGGD